MTLVQELVLHGVFSAISEVLEHLVEALRLFQSCLFVRLMLIKEIKFVFVCYILYDVEFHQVPSCMNHKF